MSGPLGRDAPYLPACALNFAPAPLEAAAAASACARAMAASFAAASDLGDQSLGHVATSGGGGTFTEGGTKGAAGAGMGLAGDGGNLAGDGGRVSGAGPSPRSGRPPAATRSWRA